VRVRCGVALLDCTALHCAALLVLPELLYTPEVFRGELLVATEKHVQAAKSFAAAAVVRDDQVLHVRSVQLFATRIAGCK
jgi:hypothetical protein